MEKLENVCDTQTIIALRAALDEGEASPDIMNFDPKVFLQELKAERKRNS